MPKLISTSFKNSDTCKGIVFTSDGSLDMAEIVISGRYPERGWARNRECHEMVRVLQGTGSAMMRNEDEILLEPGDVVHIPPGKQFAWDGTMTILMTCSPAFNSEQYEIEEDI